MNDKTLVFLHTLLLAVLFSFTTVTAETPPELVDIQFVAQSAGSEQVKIKLNGSYIPKAFILKDETPRIVFDFANMKQGNKVNSLTATNGSLIKRIRVGMHTDDQLKTRVVFDMATLSGVRYVQSFDDKTNTLLISITRGEPQADTAPAAQKTQDKPEKEKTSAPPVAEKAEVKTPSKTAAEQTPAPEEKTKAEPDGKNSASPEQVNDAQKKDAEPQAPLPPPPSVPVSVQPAKPVKPPAATDPQAQPTAAPAGDSKATAPAQKQEKPTDSAPAAQPTMPAQEGAATKESTPADTGKKEATPAAAQAPAPTDVKQEEAAHPATSGPVVESIEFDGKSPKGEMVLFKLNDFHPPVIHGVEEGIPRVICDFDKAQLASSVKNLIKTEGKFVKVIRVTKNKKPERVRVVIDLEPKLSYDLQQVFFKEDKLFVIIVNTMKK
jgi:hypothetical protein